MSGSRRCARRRPRWSRRPAAVPWVSLRILWAALVLVLLAPPPAWCDDLHPIVFYTWPPDARVTLKTPSHPPAYLGPAGQVATLDLHLMGDSTCTLLFEADGYWPEEQRCSR